MYMVIKKYHMSLTLYSNVKKVKGRESARIIWSINICFILSSQ